jgi:signal transduction histidine kinase
MHTGRQLGTLALQGVPAQDGAALKPVLDTAAALLQSALRRAPTEPGDGATAEPAAAATLLERIAQHVPGVLYRFELGADMVPRFPYLSERARTLFGADPVRAAKDGNWFLKHIHADDQESVFASVIESATSLSLWRCEYRMHMADGSLRWILGTSSPQRLPDGTTVWHGYMQDVTELRELGQARQAKAAAEAANDAKTNFLSRMSHELRTPLNAVLGFAQLLQMDRDDALSDGQQRRVKLIREAGEHLLQMIGDLLDVTRIESGQLQVQIDAGPLHEVAQEAIDMLRPQAEARQVRLDLRVQRDGLRARADRTRVRQVRLNLLSNAIKYNRVGGSAGIRVVPAALVDGEPQVELHVQDTGAGIDPAQLPHLFEPFNRLGQSHSGIDGHGIGLAVTQALVVLMKGRIEARSELGQGTLFVVTLPSA